MLHIATKTPAPWHKPEHTYASAKAAQRDMATALCKLAALGQRGIGLSIWRAPTGGYWLDGHLLATTSNAPVQVTVCRAPRRCYW